MNTGWKGCRGLLRELCRIVQFQIPEHLVRGHMMESCLVPAHCFQKRVRADQIRVHKRPRITQRIVVVGFCREMHHGIRVADQRIHEFGIRDIPHDQFAPLRVHTVQTCTISCVGQLVQYRHGIIRVFEHVTDKIGSDETRAPGDKKISHNG